MWATLNIGAKRPTLNLATYASIIKIECPTADTGLRVVFDGPLHAYEAFVAWSTPDLAVFVPHENSCNGQDIAIFGVSNIKLGLPLFGKVISWDAQVLKKEDVLDTYDITIHNDQNASDVVIAMDSNYDPNGNGAAKVERIEVMNDSQAKLDCINCFTAGQARLSMNVRGGFFAGFNSYTVALKGTVKGNVDTELNVYKAPTRNNLRLKTLLIKDLFNVEVGGLFTLTPQLIVQAGLGYSTERVLTATSGFDFNYPLNFELCSSSPLDTPPTFKSNGAVTMNAHQPKISGELTLEPHMTPSINLDFSIAGQSLDLKVALDNFIQAQISLGDVTKCPQDKVNIRIFRENNVNLELTSSLLRDKQSWRLWGLERAEIHCPFCDKCPATP